MALSSDGPNNLSFKDAQEFVRMVQDLREAEARVARLRTPQLKAAELEVRRKRADIARWLRRRGVLRVPW